VGLLLGIQGRSPQPLSQPVVPVHYTANSWQGLPSPASGSQTGDPNFIAQAVATVGAAVVRIDAVQWSGDAPQASGWRWWQHPEPRPQQVDRGRGSGLIFQGNGRIITNAHVVENADAVEVVLQDGRVLPGEIVGQDWVTDIAAIQVQAQNLPTPPLGKSAEVVPGQWAIAIGNPLGLDHTVTAGIISAVERSSSQVGVPEKRVTFIQTDAAINPGNSGGPLLNDRGQVIGINTAIRADAQGLGFAIPIEKALAIAQQLFTQGKVEHPFLGIQMVNLTPALHQRLQQQRQTWLPPHQTHGILVVQVMEGSPAAVAGLRAGDLIESVGGVPVETTVQVQAQVELSTVGQDLRVQVRRSGQVQTLVVVPQALDRSQFPAQEPERSPSPAP